MISTEKREEIVTLFQDGKGAYFIASALGLDIHTVNRVRIEENFPDFPHDEEGRIILSSSQQKQIEICAKYNFTLSETAKRTNLNKELIRRYLQDWDIEPLLELSSKKKTTEKLTDKSETEKIRSNWIRLFLIKNWNWKTRADYERERQEKLATKKYRQIPNGYQSNIHTPYHPDGKWQWSERCNE